MSQVLVAMSGGVDSSAAAVLLQEQGYGVVGCTMQLWDYRRNPAAGGEPQAGRCCSLEDVYDARRVAERLGFPFYVLNLEKEFEKRVVEPFIGQYLAGQTPIPCVLCNTFLKFDRLLLFARQIGIERVATGHYARVERRGEELVLLRGRDPRKDQSYYLFELTQEQLAHIIFPVGEYEKPAIRRIAEQRGLINAQKRDSQEICFVPDRDYVGFIHRHAAEVNPDFEILLEEQSRPGPLLFKDGTELGRHEGVHRFTIGQRRGIGVAHPRPLYVLRLDVRRNAVIVGYREDLFSRGLQAGRVNWISGRPPGQELQVQARIRANHQAVRARVAVQTDPENPGQLEARLWFDEPQMAVTPGQAVVLYCGERVLGGGWIQSRIP